MPHCGNFTVTRNLVSGSFKPIPLPLWHAIIGFHRQVSIDHHAESLSCHRWCVEEGRYHTLIPFQRSQGHGLSVGVNWGSPANAALLDGYGQMYGREFLPACTIHTHVDISAFESGTDAKDEESAPGWHITLGKLLQYKEYDLDFRMRVPHTPKVRAFTRVDLAYDLDWSNLFSIGTKKSEVFQCSGTTDFHGFLARVTTI